MFPMWPAVASKSFVYLYFMMFQYTWLEDTGIPHRVHWKPDILIEWLEDTGIPHRVHWKPDILIEWMHW